MTDLVGYQKNVSTFGARQPCGWDGGSQHFMESVTNNARYYAVATSLDAVPVATAGFGFTDTTTSNASYNDWAAFVRPGMVPVSLYVDAEATNKFQMAVLGVSGSTVTELSRAPYPSQTSTNTGFIRAWASWPNQPTIILYGGGSNSGSTSLVAWQATIDAAGVIGTITSLGAATYPDPGAFPGAGAHYLSAVHAPIPISDRLAFQTNTRALFDRLTPTAIVDAYPLIPATTGADATRDAFFADSIAKPGHLYGVRRTSSNVYVAVADFSVSTTGSTWTKVNEWAPANSADWSGGAFGGLTGDGKVVVVTYNSTSGAAIIHYDVFGANQTLTPAVTLASLGYSAFGYVVPTLGTSGSFLVVGSNQLLQFSPAPAPPEPWLLTLTPLTDAGPGPSVTTTICPDLDAAEPGPTAVFPDPGLPDPPVLDAVLPGDTSLQAQWTPPDWTGGSDLTGWEVEANDVLRTLTDPNTFFSNVARLTNDVPYTVVVRAVNAQGVSANSNAITITPAAGLPLFEEAVPPEPPPTRLPVPPPSLFAFWPIDVVNDEGEPSPGWFSPDNWAGR